MIISMRFLAGRFHATPWDHHANEGQVEWPPAPWRLLRALVAASYRLVPAPDPAAVQSLIDRLASSLPRYALPPASRSHTRHYMPIRGGTTKVLDAFVAIGSGAGDDDARLLVEWPDVELNADDAALLDRLLDALTYLGRAESWIEACRIAAAPVERDVKPTTDGAAGGARMLAPMAPAAYREWRSAYIERHTAGRRKPVLPDDLWRALHAETTDLQKAGWSLPPGARWVDYVGGEHAFQSSAALAPTHRKTKRPDFACYRVAGSVLPRIEEAVQIGDRLRQALMSHTDDRSASYALFSGRSGNSPARSDHNHAYYLPAALDDDRHIDHILVFARSGFDEVAIDALEQTTRLFARDHYTVELVLTAVGDRRDYVDRYVQLGPAREWISHTPFIPTRHPKLRRGVWLDSPIEQVRRELAHHGHPDAAIEPFNDQGVPWHRFRSQRTAGGGARGMPRAYGFRLTFAEPVLGPIALGYAAHMGLGQFLPRPV